MRYYFAPLQGVTGYLYRRTHARYFPGVDKYFTPFISTNQNRTFTNKELREVSHENNAGLDVVPQLLSKVASEFLHATKMLGDMGYTEVNLNLGCPSGTVVAKGKGSGFLAKPDELDRFLDEVFSGAGIKVSIKTRLGIREPGEFEHILEIFNRYPVAELTIHPRVQRDFYTGMVRLDAFETAFRESASPVCYNGDLKTQDDIAGITARFPQVRSVMIGRGLAANPALVTRYRGGEGASREKLRAFHDELYEGNRRDFGNDHNAVMRMKELWSYMMGLFVDGEKYAKRIKKAGGAEEYRAIVRSVFDELALRR